MVISRNGMNKLGCRFSVTLTSNKAFYVDCQFPERIALEVEEA